jgi:polyhydroxyalkanoate synthesis regulator phasin
MAKDRLSAVLRMLQQEKEKHGEYDQDIDRLDTENNVQDVDIDSTDVDLDNLVARVDKLEQSHIEPKVDEDSEHDNSTGYTDSERERMQQLINHFVDDDKMEKDPFGSDFTRELDPEFSKRVAAQNRKAQTSQGSNGPTTSGGVPNLKPDSKYIDWSK